MAELADSIIELLRAGTKLSIKIFDFASTLAAAGSELQNVAVEITLFCSVIKHFHQILLNGGPVHSPAIIATSLEIVDCCREVFGHIEDIINCLSNSRGPDFIPSIEFVNSVKWESQRARVKMWRSTLEACKITLQVMMTTMEAARKVSRQEISKVGAAADDELDKALTQSLLFSQRCAVDRLKNLEDESESEKNPIERRLGRDSHRVFRALGLMPVSTTLDGSAQTPWPQQQLQQQQRMSGWLSNVISVDEETPFSDPHPGTRQERLSSAGVDHLPMQLMRKWMLPENHSKSNGGVNALYSQDHEPRRDSFSFVGQKE